jgi:hypothetical protein
MALNGVWIIDTPISDEGRLNVPSEPYVHVYGPAVISSCPEFEMLVVVRLTRFAPSPW